MSKLSVRPRHALLQPHALRLRISLTMVLSMSVLLVSLASYADGVQPPRSPDDPLARTPTTEIKMAPVILDGAVLFLVRGTTSVPPEQRARFIHEDIKSVASNAAISPEEIKLVETDFSTNIMSNGHLIMSVFDADGRVESLTRHEMAMAHSARIRTAIEEYRKDRSPETLIKAALKAGAATILLIVALWLVSRGIRRLKRTVEERYKNRVHGLTIESFEVIQAERIWSVLTSTLTTLRFASSLILVFLYFYFVLNLFPWTRFVAVRLTSWVIDPFITMGNGIITYLPNLFFLAILYLIVRYILKMTRLFFGGVERGLVRIAGFEADWAQPTYKIIRLLIIVFALITAYPYVPGGDSPAFKGLSIFFGLLLSLSSSSTISNIIAGYALIYRRAFKIGDRIKIGDMVGDVMMVRLQATHLRTTKNEEIIVPNSKILNSEVVNYSSLARTEGLILSTAVGIGYEIPWRQVEAMLRIAADRTAGLLKNPPPFIRHKSLDAFAVAYTLNAYCDNPRAMNTLYTEMHRNILDVFNEYGVQIMTPAYEGDPDQPKVVTKAQWYQAPAEPNKFEEK